MNDIEQLLELGRKNNSIDLAPPLFGAENKNEMMLNQLKRQRKQLSRWYKFFNIGFYISLVIYLCSVYLGLIFTGLLQAIVIIVALVIYFIFLIGKGITETKLKDNAKSINELKIGNCF